MQNFDVPWKLDAACSSISNHVLPVIIAYLTGASISSYRTDIIVTNPVIRRWVCHVHRSYVCSVPRPAQGYNTELQQTTVHRTARYSVTQYPSGWLAGAVRSRARRASLAHARPCLSLSVCPSSPSWRNLIPTSPFLLSSSHVHSSFSSSCFPPEFTPIPTHFAPTTSSLYTHNSNVDSEAGTGAPAGGGAAGSAQRRERRGRGVSSHCIVCCELPGLSP